MNTCILKATVDLLRAYDNETDSTGEEYALKISKTISNKIIMQLNSSTLLSVWEAIAMCLNGLDLIMGAVGGDAYASFSRFASKIVKSAFDKVGWDALPTDGHSQKILRSTIVGTHH